VAWSHSDPPDGHVSKQEYTIRAPWDSLQSTREKSASFYPGRFYFPPELAPTRLHPMYLFSRLFRNSVWISFLVPSCPSWWLLESHIWYPLLQEYILGSMPGLLDQRFTHQRSSHFLSPNSDTKTLYILSYLKRTKKSNFATYRAQHCQMLSSNLGPPFPSPPPSLRPCY
jgi:hypothetical protein